MDNNDNDSMDRKFVFPSLRNIIDYPKESLQAVYRGLKDKSERAKNEQMVQLHELNKKHYGTGGLEEITPDMSPERQKEIVQAKEHLERMANMGENIPMMGGLKAIGAPRNAAEAILQARQAGKSVAVVPEATQSLGKVINVEKGENIAQALQKAKEPVQSSGLGLEDIMARYARIKKSLGMKDE